MLEHAAEVSMVEGNRKSGRGRDVHVHTHTRVHTHTHTHRVQLSLGKSVLYQISNCSGSLSGGARAT